MADYHCDKCGADAVQDVRASGCVAGEAPRAAVSEADAPTHLKNGG